MTDLDRYKAKLTRLLKHKAEEPNNTYHDWDAEIQRCKNNIADEVMDENTGWIPVSDRLPSNGEIVFVTVKRGYVEAGYYDDAREEWWKVDDDGLLDVIAWFPSPELYHEQTKDKLPGQQEEEIKGCSGECDFCPDADGCEQCGSV